MNVYQQIDVTKKMKMNENRKIETKTAHKFPSELQFYTARYVLNKANVIPHNERSLDLERTLDWARLTSDFAQVKSKEVLNRDLEKTLQSKATGKVSVDLPDYKKVRTATCQFRYIMKTPESKRDERQKEKMKWCQDVLNLNYDQLYYIFKMSTRLRWNLLDKQQSAKTSSQNKSNARSKEDTTKNTVKPANKSNGTAASKRHIPVIISNPNDKPAKAVSPPKAMNFGNNTSSYTFPHPHPPQSTLPAMPPSMNQFQNSFTYNTSEANMMYPVPQTTMRPMTSVNNFQTPFMYNPPAGNTSYPVYPPYMGASAPFNQLPNPNPANTFQSSEYNPLNINKTNAQQSHKSMGDYLSPSNPMMYPNPSTTTSESSQPAKMVFEANYVGPVPPEEELQVGLVDRNHIYGDINAANMELVNNRLIPLFLEVLKQRPEFTNHKLHADLYQGRIMLFTFENQRVVELFKKTVYNLGGLWPSANITVIPKSYIPHRPRYRAFIPAEPSDPEIILKIIKVGNPKLPTHNWEVIKVEPVHKHKRCICIVMNKESFEPLFSQNMIINYGFGCIRLKMYKRDKLPSEKAAFEAKYNGKQDPAASHPLDSSAGMSVGRQELQHRSSADESRTEKDTVTLLAEAIFKQLKELERSNAGNVNDEGSTLSKWF